MIRVNPEYQVRVQGSDRIVFVHRERCVIIDGTSGCAAILRAVSEERSISDEAADLVGELIERGVLLDRDVGASDAEVFERLPSAHGSYAEVASEVVDRISQFVDRSCGILFDVDYLSLDRRMPLLRVVRGIGVTSLNFQPRRFVASGKGTSPSEAVESMLGEAVERYSLGYIPAERLVFATAADLKDALNPNQLVSFAPAQFMQAGFPFADFNAKSCLRWTPAERWPDKQPGFIPAQFVYLGYHSSFEEPRLWISTSSGAAAARSLEEAMMGALLENIERDVALRAWYLQSSLIDIVGDFKYELLGSIPGGELDLRLYAVPNEFGIPVCWTILYDKLSPVIANGTAAALDWPTAARKATIEAGQLFIHLVQSAHAADGGVLFRTASPLDHARFYCDQRTRDVLIQRPISRRSRLKSLASRLQDMSTHEALSECVRILSTRGFEVWAIDVCSPEARSLGYNVKRVVVPGLVPFHFGMFAPLSMGRLVGAKSTSLPHPFA